MSMALQKPWMKDLTPPVIDFAKEQAVKATEAWNNTVEGVLKAAKAVYEVREKIGGKGGQGKNPGSFGGWAEEELKRAPETAACLARIGERFNALNSSRVNLPPSWGTLYELAKESDSVFRLAIRRVRPEMTRGDVFSLVSEIQRELAPPPATPKATKSSKAGKSSKAAKKDIARITSPSVDRPATPKDAARQLTVNWKQCRKMLELTAEETKRDIDMLSREAREYLLHNDVQPMQKILEEVTTWLADKDTQVEKDT